MGWELTPSLERGWFVFARVSDAGRAPFGPAVPTPSLPSRDSQLFDFRSFYVDVASCLLFASWSTLTVLLYRNSSILFYSSGSRLFIALSQLRSSTTHAFAPCSQPNRTSHQTEKPKPSSNQSIKHALHKMAFEALAPILTPEALRSIQADSSPLITIALVLTGLSLEGALIWYISFVTAPPVDKSKPKPKGKGLMGFFGKKK
jgi:hypothetical protein